MANERSGAARRLLTRRALPHASAALVLAYAVSLLVRPAGEEWDRLLDVGLRNTPWIPAIIATWIAVRRAPGERLAWCALTASLAFNSAANVIRPFVAGAGTDYSSALLAVDLLSLGAYLTLWVTLVELVRSRVPRFHPSMWLDGLIGACGASALGLAFLLGPYLVADAGREPLPLLQLALPVTDVLLVTLLVAVGSILGLRLDRTAILLTLALGCVFVGDLVLFTGTVAGSYTRGGPAELTWLVGVVLVTVAASTAGSASRSAEPVEGSRLGWRLLSLPLACTMSSVGLLIFGWHEPLPMSAGWLAAACILIALTRMAVTFREVRAFNEVRTQSRTDELTGLPNRRQLLEDAARVLADASAKNPLALLLLDLDGFKEVNDSLGHTAGDLLLRQIGTRLAPALRPGELLARLGGDEFAVLLPEASLDQAQERAERLRELILEPFAVEDFALHVGVSIGVATAPVPAATVQDLLRCADIAMYAAKRAREGVRVYLPDPGSGTGDRLRTMEELRAALGRDELVVHLQPQVAFADGRVMGVEALVRWQHPVRGLLSPAELLPAAEQAGLLRPLTDVVLDLALCAARQWWSADAVPVSVNLSAANVTDLDLPGKVESALARYGLPAHALTLELVEDTLMADPDRGRLVLAELRQLGVRTSIDDYGTGYSSLAYLRHLPADELKLDRSLTADVDRDPRAAAIVRHTVALAHDLGLRLVAEGVEDAVTASALRRLGCDVAQGYGIARPMPVDDFLGWLDGPRASPLQADETAALIPTPRTSMPARGA